MIPSSDIRRPQLAILNENPNNQGAIYKEQESNDPSKKSSTIKNDKSNDTELQRYFAFSKRIPKSSL
jgi:hypothetical protein